MPRPRMIFRMALNLLQIADAKVLVTTFGASAARLFRCNYHGIFAGAACFPWRNLLWRESIALAQNFFGFGDDLPAFLRIQKFVLRCPGFAIDIVRKFRSFSPLQGRIGGCAAAA